MAFAIPAGTGYAGIIPLQIIEARLASDITTTDTTNPPTVDMLSQAITTVTGTVLYIWASVSFNNDTAAQITRIVLDVDGTNVDGAGATHSSANANESISMMRRITGLSAAAHTVTIEWGVGGNTSACNASSNVFHHCTILLIEATG